jgi:hypothetical protein
MGYSIKQSSAAYPLVFLLLDSADHLTPKLGLTPTVTLSKNGGSFGSPAGAITEVGNGWYRVGGHATDTNTLGPLILHATATGADPADVLYPVVAFESQDSIRLGLTALPNAAAEAVGGLYTRGTGAGQINQPANGQVDTRWVAGNVTVGTLVANSLTAAALAPDAVTEIQGAILSDATPFPGANIDATVSSRLASASYTAPDNAGISTIQAKTDALPAQPAAVGSAMTLTVGERDAVTDSIWDEPLSGHTLPDSAGDALDASSLADDPWNTPIPGSYPPGTAGQILGDNLDVQVSALLTLIDTEIAAILAKTNQLTFTTTGKVDATLQAASDLATAVGQKVADIVLRRVATQLEASVHGDVLATNSLYGLIQRAEKSDTTTHIGEQTIFQSNGVTEVGRIPLTLVANAEEITGFGD